MAMQTPAPCDYSRATSVDDAIAQLQALGGNARILAGGYSLIPMMKLRLANPGHVIDINPLEPELSYIRQEGNEIRIGALTRHVMMLESDLLSRVFPDIFREAEAVLADPVVRNRGTMGGSLCQSDPAEDLSGVVVALKGQAVLRGPGGAERIVDMDEFHIGPYMTAVQPTEMLIEVRFPIHQGFGGAHEKVERRAGDFAIVAASAALSIQGGTDPLGWHRLQRRRPDHDAHQPRAEEALVGQAPSEQLFQQAGQMASADCSPNSDGRGPADYKRAVAGVLTQRALSRAAATALALGGDTCSYPSTSTARCTRTTSSRACCWSTSSASTRNCTAPTGAVTPPTAGSASSSWTTRTARSRRIPIKSCTMLAAVARGLRHRHGRGHGQAGRHAGSDPDGLPRDARTSVRLLYPGDDVHGALADREDIPTQRR